MRLFFVRHEKIDLDEDMVSSGLNPSLTAEGKRRAEEKARQFAEALGRNSLVLLVDTGVKRTRETAKPFADRFPMAQTRTSRKLGEANLGLQFAGRDKQDVRQLLLEGAKTNETLDEFCARVLAGCTEELEAAGELGCDTVIIFGHDVVGRILRCAGLDLPLNLDTVLASDKFNYGDVLEFRPEQIDLIMPLGRAALAGIGGVDNDLDAG